MEEAFFTCPHCWETVSILVDISLDGRHRFVEDCEVCCNPIDFVALVTEHSVTNLEANPAQ
ncbi:MAG TPA: CPXCG motif-containing cysteine-rich protein [Phycisphaerales bacterium]|nr:CPXCG motif-containing cysteine-rich protein [Phycisphaerales bacterium]